MSRLGTLPVIRRRENVPLHETIEDSILNRSQG